ncbi:MAG: DUF4194 domain-containing protein [Candidatus Endonucleobacter bathymodioli]|uniref:DUF4194 domain-containing protein n=1 Tax=Candidatus Endonucleibacter bathymodioli TaxID=539814 RepID=A0AA90NTC5_9GAMM|nr:DUF4194 domain-containing protein [Candidatus Endonucleobacter bathymodioli]
MANNSPPNSSCSIVTGEGVTGKELTSKNEEIRTSDDDRSSGSDENNSSEAESSGGAELARQEKSESDMPHEARYALVYLMRKGSVIAAQKSKLFELVCRHAEVIRRHLSEVYLGLVLDQKRGVAFIAMSDSDYKNESDNSRDESDAGSYIEGQEDLELEEFPMLISKRTLSLYDTFMLLVLRKHYQDRESLGEQKITIDIERLESYLIPFLSFTGHASKDRKKLLARVKEMVKKKLLSTISGTEDRYEITPIIRYVVDASFLESMKAEYTSLASGQTGLNDEGKRKQDNGGTNE